MSVYSGPEIADSGLVLALDAANPKCYKVNYNNYSSYYAWDNTYGWRNIFPAGASVTSGIADPFGGTGAVRFSCTNTTNALMRVYFPSFTPSGGEPWVVSFYARKISGTGTAFYDLNDATPSGDYSSQLITGQWVRVAVTATPAATARSFFDIFSDNNTNYVLDFFGLQVEPGTTPSNYSPTYGAILPRTINYDLTGTNTVTANSVSYGGLSYSFNGVNNWITMSGSSTFQQLQVPMTITAAFKTSTSQTFHTIFGKYKSTSSSQLFSLFRIDSGTLVYYISATGGGIQQASSGTTITPGNWYIASIIIGGSTSGATYQFVINGSSVASGTFGSALSTTPDATVVPTIGATDYGGGIREPFNGSISDVWIHNRALTVEECKELFNANRGRFGL